MLAAGLWGGGVGSTLEDFFCYLSFVGGGDSLSSWGGHVDSRDGMIPLFYDR